VSELPRCASERAFCSSCVSLFARSLGVSEGESLWANAPEINSSVEIAVTINKRMAGYTFLQASPIRKVPRECAQIISGGLKTKSPGQTGLSWQTDAKCVSARTLPLDGPGGGWAHRGQSARTTGG
jgi:hypothetical protein